MASVLLSAAGSAIGTSVGGSVLGIGAASIGQAIGAVAGSFIDQSLLGSGRQATDIGRAQNLRLLTSTEGARIPLIFGAVRVAGQLIWSTRFKENIRNTTQGGKATGGKPVREFSYTISFAIGLGEGIIDKVGQVWADGQLISLQNTNYRLYLGDDTQLPDPKIEAVEGQGTVPSYRGLAYIVFEDFEIEKFGNRIPQLNFEVFRSPNIAESLKNSEERGVPLRENINAVTLSPGTGDFSLHPKPVYYIKPGQPNKYANINNTSGDTDFIKSLNQLQEELPNCKHVSLIVSWFGTDLRAGRCKVLPKIEERNRRSAPYEWSVSGLTTGNAELISRNSSGQPNFGSTPSDSSVINAIRELKSRGLSVMLYPFLLMDIPENNTLQNPYNLDEYQPKFPWRGRITLDKAPDQIGTNDLTPSSVEEIEVFFGKAKTQNFSINGENVIYHGIEEWSWNRFVLHLANIAKIAGGVDSICIGSELRGLTTIRKTPTEFPSVEKLIDLSEQVRQILPNSLISYAADWSEYFGYHPQDGSNDVIFHLDDLWSNNNIDFIGIDDYTPLSDWRDIGSNFDFDTGIDSIYQLKYLKRNIRGGEYYDFYYKDEDSRKKQIRTEIKDLYLGEDWIFKPKDFNNWWSNRHYNRINGKKNISATSWVPKSKPIIFTECGCPAIRNGSNQPNVFLDGKSSESALPYFSNGKRDDEIQKRFLQAKIEYWKNIDNNLISSVYNENMIYSEKIYVWTWDVRPWPDFPLRKSVWADSPAHHTGHWITGRATSASLRDAISEICDDLDLQFIDSFGISGTVYGYASIDATTIREALAPLVETYFVDMFESNGKIKFDNIKSNSNVKPLLENFIDLESNHFLSLQRDHLHSGEGNLNFKFINGEREYQINNISDSNFNNANNKSINLDVNIVFPVDVATEIYYNKLIKEKEREIELNVSMGLSNLFIEPADVVEISEGSLLEKYKVESISVGSKIDILASRVLSKGVQFFKSSDYNNTEKSIVFPGGEIKALIMDLTIAQGVSDDYKPWFAVYADPWVGSISVHLVNQIGGLEYLGSTNKRSQIGCLVQDIFIGNSKLIDRSTMIIKIFNGNLSSVSEKEFLNGKNKIAIRLRSNEWSIIYFQFVEMIDFDLYKISHFRWGVLGSGGICGEKIHAGSDLVILDNSVVQLNIDKSALGEDINLILSHEEMIGSIRNQLEVTTSLKSNSEEPIAPCHLKLKVDTKTEDIHITWIRSTRVRAEEWSQGENVLGEVKELYKVEIVHDEEVIREILSDIESTKYNRSDQIVDGNYNEFVIRVSQFSNEVGFGRKSEVNYERQ